jgi:hypothetical protein
MATAVTAIKIQGAISVANCLGMVITRDFSAKTIRIAQPALVKKILEATGHLEESHARVQHPYSSNFLDRNEGAAALSLKEVRFFQSVLMMVGYLTKWSRFDLKFSVAFLATKMHSPTRIDFRSLLRVVAFIRCTQDFYLLIRPTSMQLSASIDSSFALHLTDRKSHAGIIIFVGGSPVAAISQKMSQVNADTTMAEMGALSLGTKELLWFLYMMRELGFEQGSIPIDQDNSSSILLASRGPGTGKSRYFEVAYFFTKEYLESGVMHLVKVQSQDLIADYLTKPEIRDFIKFSKRLLG